GHDSQAQDGGQGINSTRLEKGLHGGGKSPSIAFLQAAGSRARQNPGVILVKRDRRKNMLDHALVHISRVERHRTRLPELLRSHFAPNSSRRNLRRYRASRRGSCDSPSSAGEQASGVSKTICSGDCRLTTAGERTVRRGACPSPA